MNIVVIIGSPHRNGTSALLSDEFIRGAKEAGHRIYRFDAAFEEVHPCQGCDRCGMGSRPCIWKDGMTKLNPELLNADGVVLATPPYYFGFSAQIKTVIDRFYANSYAFTGRKKSALLATAWDANSWTMEALTAHYHTLTKYMHWKDAGMVLAVGCGTRSDIERSQFPVQAYQLGKDF